MFTKSAFYLWCEKTVKTNFGEEEDVTVLHDFQLNPNRRPKVLVQTAAHVAGAVKFFQDADVQDKELLKDVKSPKIFPVCIHPKFGGWFAIRAVVIFEKKKAVKLPKKDCSLCLSEKEIAKLLRLYNDQWQDWSFRDVIKTEERYSDMQKMYFETKPDCRFDIIDKFCEGS